ncbi:MarR family winged helix-turn-helix transcriptional regulator [Dyella telluris]|uniref:Winged helix DNA-binding protein n=1 Tax=Dyella telluris TaxID=2763498 RepID=A0A7G8Q5X4_9GAMM|nr:winged helix DNA-binding protein [Dyella telluris]QNK02182.1 winged helix DNA-binding protein [Dyella telluris]
MTDFINSQGLIFLPHILRRLANRFSDACDEVFPELGILVPPRLVSTVHLLFEQGPQAVTDIAAAVGQSHPFVIKAVKQLRALGLVDTRSDPKDGRRTIVKLTAKGKGQAQRLLDVRPMFEAAYRRLMREADAEIYESLWRLESALGKQDFLERLAAEQA